MASSLTFSSAVGSVFFRVLCSPWIFFRVGVGVFFYVVFLTSSGFFGFFLSFSFLFRFFFNVYSEKGCVWWPVVGCSLCAASSNWFEIGDGAVMGRQLS